MKKNVKVFLFVLFTVCSYSCSNLLNKDVSVSEVSLDKTNISITIGSTEQLTATVSPDDATNKSLLWKSSDESIVTVSTTGLISAITVGTSTITVATSDGNKTASCLVTVIPISISSIVLDKSSAEIAVGETEMLAATILPNNATNKNIIWKSSDIDVASVNDSGLVTGIAEGSANITAVTVDGNYSDSCSITVKEKVKNVSFSIDGGMFASDQTLSLSTETSDAVIYYTVDGSDPTESSIKYENSFTVSGTNTTIIVKAIAIKNGMFNSDIESSSYVFTCKIKTAFVSPDGMSVTMNYITIVRKTGSYQYTINYTLKNTTTDKELDEGAFVLKNETTGNEKMQYGFFGSLFPDDTKTRSYTFEDVLANKYEYCEYMYTFATSKNDDLKWAIEYSE